MQDLVRKFDTVRDIGQLHIPMSLVLYCIDTGCLEQPNAVCASVDDPNNEDEGEAKAGACTAKHIAKHIAKHLLLFFASRDSYTHYELGAALF